MKKLILSLFLLSLFSSHSFADYNSDKWNLKDAVIDAKYETAKEILERGFDDLDIIFRDQSSYLGEALELADYKMARLLIKHGADVNLNINRGWTILHRVTLAGHPGAAEFLIENGANVNVRDSLSGHTPLHVAAFRGNSKIVEALIRNGADVNARNKKQETPLHLYTITVDPETRRILFDNGADPNAKDENGQTPFHWLVGGKDKKNFSIENGAKSKSDEDDFSQVFGE